MLPAPLHFWPAQSPSLWQTRGPGHDSWQTVRGLTAQQSLPSQSSGPSQKKSIASDEQSEGSSVHCEIASLMQQACVPVQTSAPHTTPGAPDAPLLPPIPVPLPEPAAPPPAGDPLPPLEPPEPPPELPPAPAPAAAAPPEAPPLPPLIAPAPPEADCVPPPPALYSSVLRVREQPSAKVKAMANAGTACTATSIRQRQGNRQPPPPLLPTASPMRRKYSHFSRVRHGRRTVLASAPGSRDERAAKRPAIVQPTSSGATSSTQEGGAPHRPRQRLPLRDPGRSGITNPRAHNSP